MTSNNTIQENYTMPQKDYFAQIKNDLVASVKENMAPMDVLVGLNLTAVETKNLGIASTVFDLKSPFIKIESAGKFKDLTTIQLVNKLKSVNPLEASLGLAALNSTIDISENMQTINAYQIIEEKAAGNNVCVIGHFPFVERLKKISKKCRVFEKRPRPGDYTSEELFTALPDCKVLVITGQTIINGSIGKILNASEHTYKIMLGPSTPLSPVLLDYGIDVIGGTFIHDKRTVKKYITQAAHYRELTGVERLILKK